MSNISRCWCGNQNLQAFSNDYFRCPLCETLIAADIPDPEQLLVGEDERGLYGRSYFESYQVENLGLPAIVERARLDLGERCVHWLRTLLRYKLPPATVLELGSSHGGFVAMMHAAGYEATGLELSPWVVEFARKTFGVPMLQGPVEDQLAQPQSFDAIVLMDVLEHLPDPEKTLRHCVRLLKPGGILLIQTPSYREGMSLKDMHATGDEFVKMLLPDQHLYLFSKQSVAMLLRRLGIGHVQFETAIFSAYDMFLVGSAVAASIIPEEEIDAALSASREGRLVRALLDLRSSFEDLTARYAESEADRANRLRMIIDQGQRLAKMDRTLSAFRIRRPSWQLAEQKSRRANSDANRSVTEAGNEEPRRPSAKVEADERRRKIETLDVRTSELEAFPASAEASARDAKTRDAKTGVRRLEIPVAERGRRASEGETDLASKPGAPESVRLDLQFARELFERLQASYIYRLMRRLGLWEWLWRGSDRMISGEGAEALQPLAKRLERVVVDLTPVLPGGENGGAKIMTIELLRQFSRLAKDCDFILLTSPSGHDELAFLDSSNMRRICVQGSSTEPATPGLLLGLRQRITQIFPAAISRRLGSLYSAVSSRSGGLLRQLQPDILFCPFTAPAFFDPRVPTVSVIYDLQHVYYPSFFSEKDRGERDRNFRKACADASTVICISEYVRQTVLDNAPVKPERVQTIHISLPNRVAEPSPAVREKILDRFDLREGSFLMYPANFWPHKNHEMLLTAFGMYRARHPVSKLKLVLTGAPGKRQEYIREAAGRMALNPWTVFAGYLPDSEYAGLLWSSLALVYPSLYEGFGMPLLEAMAAGKPVLCSKATSLPEVAADAAILFDPRKPREIAEAIACLANDPKSAPELVARGSQRVRSFGGPREMANRYLQVFQEATGRSVFSGSRIHGVYSDGWAAGRLVITFADGPAERKLMVDLSAPEWAPTSPSRVRVLPEANGFIQAYSMARGEKVRVQRVLPPEGGSVEIEVQPEFQPSAWGIGQDNRWIGCRFGSARILFPDGTLTSPESDSHET